LLLFTIWFFRDPTRRIPDEPGAVVAPADGKIVRIEEMEEEEFIGGPATRIDIFLAVYNVHVNRASLAGEVRYLADRDGPYLNAMNLAAGAENKAKTIGFVAEDGGFRFVVRQIVGAVARRIVCDAREGERYGRGERIGMIKFGSRTQLSISKAAEFEVRVKVGDRVRGGATVLGVIRKGDPS
jgi:phosphatidylserine decarboxylase